MSFTTVFAIGGINNTVWQRCQPVATRAEADAQVVSIVKAGRPAYADDTCIWDVIGLPDGHAPLWDYERLCWKPRVRHGRKALVAVEG